MAAVLTAAERELATPVVDYCEQHGLLPHVLAAARLAEQSFQPVAALRVGIESDPETDEAAVVVDVVTSLGAEEATARKREYTRRWVGSVPPEIIGQIRLVLDVVA